MNEAALIYAPTQSGKTWKCFDVLVHKLQGCTGNICIIFITQANNAMSANQIKQRASNHSKINRFINPRHVLKSNEKIPEKLPQHMFVCDYWNSRNMNNIYTFLESTHCHWNKVIVVIDECDQGDLIGVKTRLECFPKIESIVKCPIVPIFITATIANLSNLILRISEDNVDYFKSSIIASLINKPIVEKYFARPGNNYVGPSWFTTSWKELKLPKANIKMNVKDVEKQNQMTVIKALKDLPDYAKESCLVVVSTSVVSHGQISDALLKNNTGFNVTVEINSINNKNYIIKYLDINSEVNTWELPWSFLDKKADSGKLKEYGIFQKDDITLPLVLQAVIFIGSDAEKRIRDNVDLQNYNKLKCISKNIRQRPEFPSEIRVAIIAGHTAGRGITFQDPTIDFTYTSFCFTGKNDKARRGAANAQKFGRACGNLLEIYTKPNRRPVMITTRRIIQDAISNEETVMKKGSQFEDGMLVSIKDLVPKNEWDLIYQKTETLLKTNYTVKMKQLLTAYIRLSENGKKSFTYDDIKKDSIANTINDTDHRRTHRQLVKMELIIYDGSAFNIQTNSLDIP